MKTNKILAGKPNCTYYITLITVGLAKLRTIKEVSDITGLGLKDSKELVDDVIDTKNPLILARDLTLVAMNKLEMTFKRIGCTVETGEYDGVDYIPHLDEVEIYEVIPKTTVTVLHPDGCKCAVCRNYHIDEDESIDKTNYYTDENHRKQLKQELDDSNTQKADFTVIAGIDFKIQEIFAQAGITTFKQFAETPASHIEDILGRMGYSYLATKEDIVIWCIQAGLAAAGNWGEMIKSDHELQKVEAIVEEPEAIENVEQGEASAPESSGQAPLFQTSTEEEE